MAKLDLFLLGPIRARLDESDIEVKPRKALALLTYLAATAESHSRDFLAAMLWPDSDHSTARRNLRNRLSELNRALGGDWIEADRQSVGLQGGFWLDVTEFQRNLAQGAVNSQALITAVDLYHDDFLTGFTLPDSPLFDEWQFFQRESLRQSLALALERLASALSDRADYETAVPYARRWLALDPLHEPAHRRLMQLYVQAGQRAAALRQYDRCRQTLENELGISPSPETRALYQSIHAGNVIGRDRGPPPRHNLPVQTTTFIGRQSEMADIKRLLFDEPGCRLLNLVGPGGVGKTRLALAAAAQVLDYFPDGTYLVPLASVSDVEAIVPTIAEVVGLTFSGTTDPKVQLLNYLSRKQLLLILDNFERLLMGVDLIAAILSQAPAVTVLATSRERMNLREEWLYEVQGLSFPTISHSSEILEPTQVINAYSAVKLFYRRARQIVTNFTPSSAEMGDIVQICQLLNGMPLGLELAAPWVHSMTCREIADEIKQNLDFLATSLHNVPERHRSLRVVFEQTWQRLSREEHAVLQRLSVFHGSCTREAAQQVTGATPQMLSSLVERALLRRTNTGRYELHELLRQYAAAELELSGKAEAARKAHSLFYLDFLRQREEDVKGRRQVAALDEIGIDFDNVRAAWRWATSRKATRAIGRALESLYWYCVMRNRYREILSLLRVGREDLAPAAGVRPHLIWAKVAARTPSPGRVFAEPLAEVKMRVETALAIAREHGDKALEAFCLWRLGVAVFNDRDDFGEVLARCERSLAIYQTLGDRFYQAQLFDLTGLWHLRLNQPERGARLMQQGANLRRLLGDKVGLAISLRSLGWIAYHRGHFAEAESCWQEAYQLARETRGRQETLYRHTGIAWLALFNRGDLVTAETIAEEMQSHAFEISSTEWKRQAQILLGFLAGMAEDYAACRNYMEQAAYRRKYTYNIAWMRMGLCLAACGLGEMQKARERLEQVLEMSLARQWPAVIAQCLPFAALITADAGEAERVVELLALAFHHPASPKGWLAKWPLLTRLRTELESELSATSFATAWERGEALDLEMTAQALLLAPASDRKRAGSTGNPE